VSLLVVGTLAYDSVTTSIGSREESLGGSGMYFSVSSNYFTNVSLVAVVGSDFKSGERSFLANKNIDISNVETKEGDTFRWKGIYDTNDPNSRETVSTDINVLAQFSPILTEEARAKEYLFLANIDPSLQINVLKQMASRPKLVGLDTMDFWINGDRNNLSKIIELIDVLFMDESEIKSFTGKNNIFDAADLLHGSGPKVVVVKKGEHGVTVFNQGKIFAAPAYPLNNVTDPTGAGDSFAGGFMGYLAKTQNMDFENLRRATIAGTVMGSFAVQGFSVERLANLSNNDINERYDDMVNLTRFSSVSEAGPLAGKTDQVSKI